MITVEHKKYGQILIIEPTDKNHKLLNFGKNKKGIETVLSHTAGFAQIYSNVDLIVYRNIRENHINVKRGPVQYDSDSEFKKFIFEYGQNFQPIVSRFEILDL